MLDLGGSPVVLKQRRMMQRTGEAVRGTAECGGYRKKPRIGVRLYRTLSFVVGVSTLDDCFTDGEKDTVLAEAVAADETDVVADVSPEVLLPLF